MVERRIPLKSPRPPKPDRGEWPPEFPRKPNPRGRLETENLPSRPPSDRAPKSPY